MSSCSKTDVHKDNVSNSLRDVLTHLNVVLESFQLMHSSYQQVFTHHI